MRPLERQSSCPARFTWTRGGWLCLALGLAACSVLPPTQEMSDARLAIKAAREVEADKYFPSSLYCAEHHLQTAEQGLETGNDYTYARFNALAAKEAAMYAHKITKALLAARTTLQAAENAGHLWLFSEDLLARAEAAARTGDAPAALALAEQARLQGENALAQAALEYAKYLAMRIEALTLTPDQHAALHRGQDALAQFDGGEAQRVLGNLAEELGVGRPLEGF